MKGTRGKGVISTRTLRMETHIDELGENIGAMAADPELTDMTEGPFKDRILQDLKVLNHAIEIMDVSLTRLRRTIGELNASAS